MTTTEERELAKGITDVAGPEEDDRRYWSVTTLLNVLGSEGLIGWAAREAAECAVKQTETWRSIEQSSGTLEAVRWIAGARFRPPKGEKTSAELGSAVHAAVEAYALEGRRPRVDPDVKPFVDRFDEWCQTWQPRYHATEFSIYSPRYGYAGTGDAILSLAGPGGTMRVLVDYKTSREGTDRRGVAKTPYPEAALQIAAYRYAELAAVYRARRFEHQRRRYYLLNAAERDLALPVPEVDGGAVLMITPESCDLYPVRCDEQIFDAFLAVVDAARYILQTGLTVIGSPLVKP